MLLQITLINLFCKITKIAAKNITFVKFRSEFYLFHFYSESLLWQNYYRSSIMNCRNMFLTFCFLTSFLAKHLHICFWKKIKFTKTYSCNSSLFIKNNKIVNNKIKIHGAMKNSNSRLVKLFYLLVRQVHSFIRMY